MKRSAMVVLLMSTALIAAACSPAAMQALGAGLAAAGQAANPTQAPELLVFGGQGHKTFLGCFCGQYETGSLFNQYSQYGSKYSATSIFNHYSDYGSLYSAYSACSAYAADPPVIVTRGGEFVGRLTLNRYAAGAITDNRVIAWLAAACKP